jgi:hypothetical protein
MAVARIGSVAMAATIGSVATETTTLKMEVARTVLQLDSCEAMGLGWRFRSWPFLNTTTDCWYVGSLGEVQQKVADAKYMVIRDGEEMEVPVLFKRIYPIQDGKHFLGWVRVYSESSAATSFKLALMEVMSRKRARDLGTDEDEG